LEIRRAEVVGPKVGKDLKEKALWAVGLSFVAILIYVAWRFKQVSYGLGGIVALLHDVIVTYGAISIAGIEYSLNVLAVVLTIVGFSINDTIVIFDRVRENIKKMRKENLETIFNVSINETLGRTILTNGTVMMVVLILFFFVTGISLTIFSTTKIKDNNTAKMELHILRTYGSYLLLGSLVDINFLLFIASATNTDITPLQIFMNIFGENFFSLSQPIICISLGAMIAFPLINRCLSVFPGINDSEASVPFN
jgi:hypothetical protein